MAIVPIVVAGLGRAEPTPASRRRAAETGLPAQQVEAVYQDTWGHLRPAPGRVYEGFVLFTLTCHREVTVLDWAFEDLPGSPWFAEHLMDFVTSKVPENLDEFRLWRFEGTYRELRNGNGRFSGGVRPMRVVHRFAGQGGRRKAA